MSKECAKLCRKLFHSTVLYDGMVPAGIMMVVVSTGTCCWYWYPLLVPVPWYLGMVPYQQVPYYHANYDMYALQPKMSLQDSNKLFTVALIINTGIVGWEHMLLKNARTKKNVDINQS